MFLNKKKYFWTPIPKETNGFTKRTLLSKLEATKTIQLVDIEMCVKIQDLLPRVFIEEMNFGNSHPLLFDSL